MRVNDALAVGAGVRCPDVELRHRPEILPLDLGSALLAKLVTSGLMAVLRRPK